MDENVDHWRRRQQQEDQKSAQSNRAESSFEVKLVHMSISKVAIQLKGC